MKRLVVTAALMALLWPGFAAHAGDSVCGFRQGGNCGGVVGDQSRGDFRGLIMVRDDPSVLAAAARSGTKAGCADCSWEIVLACLANIPGQPDTGIGCATGDPTCKPTQAAYRLYLSTAAVRNQLIRTICLGGLADVIPVGNIAAADVERYLRSLRPPPMTIRTSPPSGMLAGLPGYFQAATPPELQPLPFGGPEVRETITIVPKTYRWDWGDGTGSGDTTDAGGPYPTGTLTHTFDRGGPVAGALTTRWSATYTITINGATYGPYDATGTVTRTQPFELAVRTAHSHIVSHG